jgi:hypothetical protein
MMPSVLAFIETASLFDILKISQACSERIIKSQAYDTGEIKARIQGLPWQPTDIAAKQLNLTPHKLRSLRLKLNEGIDYKDFRHIYQRPRYMWNVPEIMKKLESLSLKVNRNH